MKILHTTTPKARKEHKCQVCGKSICKGEKYLNIAYSQDGKLMSRKTHLDCCEEKKEEEKKPLSVPVEQMSEELFKLKVHHDTMEMLETFSFKENMEIAFVPFIITETAWHFASKVLKYAAENKISNTKKLSRSVKALREEYIRDCRKDIDYEHMRKMESAASEFVSSCNMDFVILFYSLNNELKKKWYDVKHLDLKTNAGISVIMLRLLDEHNRHMDKLMSKRLGREVPSYRNSINDSLRKYMLSFMEPCKISFDGNVATSMKIISKKFSQIDFEIV